VYEQGIPSVVSIDILKEFRGENNVHGFPSDPPHLPAGGRGNVGNSKPVLENTGL